MPTAEPFSAPMIGVRIFHGTTRRASSSARRLYSVSSWSNVDPPRSRSAPAEKYRPEPVTTIARTSSSASNAPNAAYSSSVIVWLNALRRSGRFSQIVATPWDTSVSRVWYPAITASRPRSSEHRSRIDF